MPLKAQGTMGDVRMKGKTSVGAGLALMTMAAVSGCNCNPTPPDCSELAIDTVPAMDAIDVAPTLDVQATLRRGNTRVSVSTATLSVRAAADADFGAASDGVVTESRAVFPGVMLKSGQNTLKVTLGERDSMCVATREVSVRVRETPMPAPVVMSVEFPQDVDRNGTLNGTELPAGTTLAVRVRTQMGTGSGSRVRLNDNVAGAQVAETDVTMDVADFVLPAPMGDSLSVNLQAIAVRGNQMSMGVNGMILIRRTTPMCANTTPELVGPNNDADANTMGFQLGLVGTVGGTVTSARFEASPGALSSGATVMGGLASGVLTIPAMGDVMYATTLIAADMFGNECRSTRNVRAKFQPPVLRVTAPASADGGTVDIFQTPLSVTVATTGLENGRQVCVSAQVAGGMSMEVGCGTVNNGMVSIVAALMTDGLTTFIVSATDSVGNRGETRFTGNVTLEGCVPAFDPALACPNTYLTSRDVMGGMYALTGSARMRCSGQAARLFIGTSTMPVATTTVAANGALAFPPVTLVPGTFDARIEVDRAGGGMPYSVTCPGIVVDVTSPALTNPALPMTPPFIVNSQQDLQDTIAGAQRTLAYSGTIPPNGTAIACMSQMTGSSGTPCPGNAGFFVMNPAGGIGPSPALTFTFPEGEYQVLVAIRRGNGINASAPVPLRVDVTRPCVASNGFTLPQDTVPMGGDGRVNVAELAGTNPRVSIQLDPACADLPQAPAPTIAVREVNAGAIGATRASGSATPGGATVLTFTDAVTNVQNLTLFAEVADWVGNRTTFGGGANPAVRTLGIYPLSPACTIDAPTANARLNAGQVSAGILAQVSTTGSGVVGTNGVEFSLTRVGGAAVVQTASPTSSGLTSSTFPSQDGAFSLGARCTDVALNQQSATAVSFEVDGTSPMGCSVGAPLANTTTSSNVIVTTVSTSAPETGATVNISSSGGAVSPATFPFAGTTANQTITYPLGTQNITVQVVDSFGNACTVQVPNVNIQSTTCVVTVNKGFVNGRTWLNRSAQGDTSITINSPNCRTGETATLTRSAGAPLTTTTSASGDAVFAVTPVDGEVYSVTVNNGAPTTIEVDFVDPQVGPGALTIAGAAPSTGTLHFVAATGNPRVATGPLATAGYYADTNPGIDGAQIAMSVTAVAGASQPGAPGRAEISLGASVLQSASIVADPETVTFGGAVTLPHPTRTATALTVRVQDQAGNAVTVFNGTARIDVISPAAPAISGSPSIDRSGSLPLAWSRVYDDGMSAGSGDATYEIRWVPTNVVTGLTSESDFFGALPFQEADVPGAQLTAALALPFLPPGASVSYALRAKDEVGNYSQLAAQTASSALSDVSLSVPGSSFYGFSLARGDFNGDGVSDLVVGAPGAAQTSLGGVFVYTGGSSSFAANQTACAANCQAIVPADFQTGQFGLALSAGNAGEPGTDLLVSQPRWAVPSTGTGRVLLYFGKTDGGSLDVDAGDYVVFQGDRRNENFGESASILPDITGDGIDDVFISAPGFDAGGVFGIGRALIWRGRSLAEWRSSGVYTSASADWEIGGPTNLPGSTGGRLYTGANNNGFGISQTGVISLGRIQGPASPNSFMVPMSRQLANRAYLFNGSQFTPATPRPFDVASAIQSLSEPPIPGGSVSTLGFGRSAISGDVIGEQGIDLIVGYPSAAGGGQISFYADLTASGAPTGPRIDVRGVNGFGGAMASGRLSSDQRTDLVVAEGASPPTGVWIMTQRRDGGFDPVSTPSNTVWNVPYNPNRPGTSLLGNSVASGDLTGEGQPDIAVGDPNQNTVRVIR
jgi:hypothetical protein